MRNILMRWLFCALLILPMASAFAQGHPVGNKMKQDPELQEKAINPGENFPFAKGDTIVISKTQTHYLTGEKIANWVYYVEHTIMQIGGKRFPEGILIDGIYSWVGAEENELLLMSAVDRGDSALNAQVRARLEHDRQAIQERVQEAANLDNITKQVIDTLSSLTGTKKLENEEPILSHEDSVKMNYAHDFDQEAFIRSLEAEKNQTADSAKADSLSRERMGKQHRFSIGVRGGVASLMQQTDNDIMGHWRAGFDALLDLQYAYYFGAREGKKTNMGIITGVSFGYSQSPVRSGVDTTYTINDQDAGTMGSTPVKYTIQSEEVKEQNGQLQLEIPILFALRHESGLFFNAGPKLVFPLWSHYKQNIAEEGTNIDAYFEEYGVHVTNEVVTGKLQESDYSTKGQWKHATIQLMLTAELGYEWQLKNGNALGLGAYGNYSAYTAYSNATSDQSLIQVGLPQAGGPRVDVFSATDSYANKLGYFDCGVKLVYHFCFPAKK